MAEESTDANNKGTEPTQEENKQEAAAAAQGVILEKLVILPPLQQEPCVELEAAATIELPPMRPEAHVAMFRSALQEVVGYAQLTNYRFVLEAKPTYVTHDKSKTITIPLISPFVGKQAVISIAERASITTTPSLETTNADEQQQQQQEVVLNDYLDLSPYLEQGLESNKSAFRIVLEPYTVASVRDHVGRVRELLNGNAPFVTTLEDEQPEQGEGDKAPTEKEKSAAGANDEKKKEKDSSPKQPVFLPLQSERPMAFDTKRLKDFFYLASGEEQLLYESKSPAVSGLDGGSESPSRKSKKKRGKNGSTGDEAKKVPNPAAKLRNDIVRMNQLEDATMVDCVISYSGFHPPPPRRSLMGDLAYLQVTMPDGTVVHVTAVPTGFYVNQSSSTIAPNVKFDPSPNPERPCFSHSLLDCLLQANESLRTAWQSALDAAKERVTLPQKGETPETALQSVFRVAVRADFEAYPKGATGLEQVMVHPSWLVPQPPSLGEEDGWTHNSLHLYNVARTEMDLGSSFGLDVRAGHRDWNEDLQMAREMPTDNIHQRIDRARLMYKAMAELGEAALLGAKAIVDGHVTPMNPNEPARSHVFLHNSIFYSQALDSGVETFKLAKGDSAVRKAVSRDASSMGYLHRLDMEGLYTMGTVLVDYLGTRLVCQALVPGILQHDNSHKLLYGAVQATAPLSWNKDVHELLEKYLGTGFMIASRKVPSQPLTDERMAEIEEIEKSNPTVQLLGIDLSSPVVKGTPTGTPTTEFCLPIEGKSIRGSDQRNYLMDIPRLTPRDANWVPKSQGGTGKWEQVMEEESKSSCIPTSLDDNEWMAAVLRTEFIANLTRKKMVDRITKREMAENAKKETADGEKKVEDEKEAKAKEEAINDEDEEYLKSMRFNVNVFLPDVKSLEGIDDEEAKIVKEDEERAREAASVLWETVLPSITVEIREGKQLPMDGQNLTELLHQHGVNCRYLGRLAQLAKVEEKKDKDEHAVITSRKATTMERKVMPLCWLEMLECEMVARAAKHVLDAYLPENRFGGSAQPAQVIASFLSALLSQSEETAGETETRMRKEGASNEFVPDEDDFRALTLFGAGKRESSSTVHIRGRQEVWDDIENEIGRRFRYHLSLYNQGHRSARAIHIPLLRRVCQRTGVCLVAKNYAIGGKCLCSDGGTTGGQMFPTFPISPLDIVDVVPVVKHCGAQAGEGFVPCNLGNALSLPALHISLADAKKTFEMAHYQLNRQNTMAAKELAQEAISLFQRVTEAPLHKSIVRCMELMTAILFEEKQFDLAAQNASRVLGLTVQLGGFDTPEVASAHATLSTIYSRSPEQVALSVKHMRAVLYLYELMAGHNFAELPTTYQKLGNILYEGSNDPVYALQCLEEARSRRFPDRVFEASACKNEAFLQSVAGNFKQAAKSEREAYRIFCLLSGPDSPHSKSCLASLQKLTEMAVQQGKGAAKNEQQKKEAEAADAIANEIAASEEQSEQARKNKKKGGKKKRKK